jgi:hypothetical protein
MKDISEMTLDELNALPVYHEFGKTMHKVDGDGTVTLPSGRVLHGLTPGHYVSITHKQNIAGAYWAGPNTPLCWRDADGVLWRLVKLISGEWMRAQV